MKKRSEPVTDPKRRRRNRLAPEPPKPLDPYLVPVATLISKGDTMPAASPLTTADCLKRILSLLNRIPEDADRKRVLAALAALGG